MALNAFYLLASEEDLLVFRQEIVWVKRKYSQSINCFGAERVGFVYVH